MTNASTQKVSIWEHQVRVIKALVLRDMASRFSDSRMGYLWGLLTPLIMFATLYVMFSIRGRMAPPGLPLVVFLSTGHALYFGFQALWSSVSNATMGEQDVGVLMFPQITLLDVVVSRMILDFLTQTAFYVILIPSLILILAAPVPSDIVALLLYFWLSLWLGAGIGMVVGSIRRLWPAFEQIVSPIRRLGFFFSGVLFTAAQLPSFALAYLDWNPIFRNIEAARQNWWPAYRSPIYDPPYVILCAVGLTAVGIIIERGTRRFAGK